MKTKTTAPAKSRNSRVQSASLTRHVSKQYRQSSSPLLQLKRIQRSLGNRTLQAMYRSGSLQARLNVGKSNTVYEKEADTIAAKVINMPGISTNQPVSKKDEDDVQQKQLAQTVTPLVQRQEAEEQLPGTPIVQREKSEEDPQAKLSIQKQEGEEAEEQTFAQKSENEEETQQRPLIQKTDEEEAQPRQLIQRVVSEEDIQQKPLLQKQEEEEPQHMPLAQRAEQEEETQQKPSLQLAETEEAPQQKVLIQKIEEEPQAKAIVQGADKEEEIQAKSEKPSFMDNDLSQRIEQKKGSGRRMPIDLQSWMENRFGADFSTVRLHTDAEAADLSKSLGARAFTLKNNIYFGPGEYNRDTSRGKELLAHELTHTIQQGTSKSQEPVTSEQNTPVKPETNDPASVKALPEENEKEKPEGPLPAKPSTKEIKGLIDAGEKASGKKPGESKKSSFEDEKEKKEKPPLKKGAETAGKATAPRKTGKKRFRKALKDPKKDPAFQSVASHINVAGKTLKEHEPAADKANQAQEAALGPADEIEAKARENQVTVMGGAKPAVFDKASFKAALKQRIKAIAPKNMEETEEFKSSGKLDAAKRSMTGRVKKGKKQSESDIAEKTEARPDTTGITPKPVVPLKTEKEVPQPQIQGMEGAAPKKRSKGEISMEEESKSLDQKMAEANVTEEQLAKSNEPEFQQALESKKTAQDSVKSAPGKFRAGEKRILGDSANIVKSNIAKEIGVMHSTRTQTMGKVSGKQVGTKGKDETERAQVTRHIKGIYTNTKTSVEGILNGLETKVITAFDTGAGKAQDTFENYVDSRMRAYKNERYGDAVGKLKWLKDAAFGMPDEVNWFYVRGRNLFIEEMDKVIDDVTDIIADELKKAADEIKQGKREIATYVAGLKPSLQKVGREAADEIQNDFDDLENQIASKQDGLVNTLAQKYVDSVKKVDARIKKMKEANRGLIAKAFDFIAGVIQTIIEIGKKLASLLKKIAGVVMDIIADPIGFLGNLLAAVKMGFNMFVDRIGYHLKKGVISWLTGSLGEANIEIPQKFDLPGIFKLVMSILGLTWDYVRSKAVKMFGEPVVQAMEKAAEVFMVIKKEGVSGLWKYLKQQFADLKETILDAIKEMIITEVIKAGVKWLLGLFNPAGAFIKAALAIYEVVKFFIQNANRIIDLINAIFDAIGAIAKGSIKSAAKMVENALGRAVPLIIGFLASLLGISGLVKKVQTIIKRIRSRIDKAVTKLLKKIGKPFKGLVEKAGKMFGAAKTKGKQVVARAGEKGKAVAAKIIQWWKEKRTVKAAGKTIRIFFETKGANINLMIKASPKRGFLNYLKELKGISESDSDYKKAVTLGQKLDKTRMPSKKHGMERSEAEKIRKDLNTFSRLIKKLNEKTDDDVPLSVIKYGSLDKNQGATSMKANPLSAKHPKGSSVRDMPPIMKNLGDLGQRKGRAPHYIQGHLLNHHLGGPGKRWNLTPISKQANSTHSAEIEQELKGRVNKSPDKGGQVVSYRVDVLKPGHSARKGFSTLKKIVENEAYLSKTGTLRDALVREYHIMSAEMELTNGFRISANQLEKTGPGKWGNPKAIKNFTVENKTGGDLGYPIREDFSGKSIESIDQEVTR